MLQLPPLSLYIHIPWCIRKCPYCDFNSHQAEGDTLPEQNYIAQLIHDIDTDRHFIQGRSIKSIFIGGGTPSLFSAKSFDTLLNKIQSYAAFDSQIEITLEANPSTFEQNKFSDYRKLGINRLSIGIQSFNDYHLKRLGRIHSSDEAHSAISVAKKAGFDNINLDLMHGLPEQTPEQALQDLKQAIDYTPQHISWYQLTVEPNTEFYSKPPQLPDDEILWDIQQLGQDILASTGFKQYEVSAYSQAHRQSQHNMNYWLFGDYLGIGAGAHGKITHTKQQEVFRYRKVRQPSRYLQENTILTASTDIIPSDQLALEFFLNAFRLNTHINRETFEARTGHSINTIEGKLAQAYKQGLLEKFSGDVIQTTVQGRHYLNNLLALF